MMNLRDKKILLTGGAGFLGSHIKIKLLARGVPETNIVIPRSSDIDLRILENCRRVVKGMDVVIHAAGITGGINFHIQNPASIFYDNMTMSIQLMEEARVAGVQKFVNVGSATEYPSNARLPFREEDLWEGPPEGTHAPYTTVKKMMCVQAAAYRKQYGFNAVHLLLTNMYGPGEPWESDFVIPATIRKVHEAKMHSSPSVEVWGTGRPTRDFLYVEDAAEGILKALENYDDSFSVNIGSGWEMSISELVELVASLMEYKGSIVYDTSRPDGQPRRVLDPSRAAKFFGFTAMTDIEEGLKRTIEWALAHKISHA